MSQYLSVYDSPAGRAACQAAYQAVLDHWPVAYTECDVPTSFGLTHAIVCGRDDAPPLVLLHALFATSMSWYRSVQGLSEHFKVYAVDVLGEANRSRPTRPIKSQAEAARWFVEFLDGAGIAQTSLVGNSFGGFMAAYYATRLPERVRRLVLIGPASTIHGMLPFYLHMFIPKMVYMLLPWLPGQDRSIESGISWMCAGLPREPLWDRLFAETMKHGLMTLQVVPRVYRREELAALRVPTLLVLGDHEQIYRPDEAARAARRLIPGLRVEMIPGAHHIAALAQPERVNQAIVDFCR